MGSHLAGTPLASPEAAPILLPGDILALVFGLLFAATSIAFLLQLRRQHRYLPPSLGTAFFCISQNSRTTNELSFRVGFLILVPCSIGTEVGLKMELATARQK